MRHLLVILTALLLFTLAVAVAGDFEDGLDAYLTDDYQKAFRLWKPLAEQGDACAQNYLGEMYVHGESVPEDDAQAVYWYRKAAEQGYAVAQTKLGLMYASGRGVPEDFVQTYAWLSIAAAQGDAVAKENKGIVAGLMTREQIAKAQELSKELWDKYVAPLQSD